MGNLYSFASIRLIRKFRCAFHCGRIDRMPVDAGSFHGYCVIFIFQIAMSVIYFIIVITIASLFLSWSLFFNTFRTHFESIFENMNELASRKATPKTKNKLKASLIEAVHLHIKAQE